MMEAAGPISPTFDFGLGGGGTGAGHEPFNLNEFVASPPDEQTDDFMASFSLDGPDQHSSAQPAYEDEHGVFHPGSSELGPSSSSSGQHPSESSQVSYAAMTIPQLQQLHQQIVASSNPSTPANSHSPASGVSPAGPSSSSHTHGHQQPGAPSETDLQAILDSMLAQSPTQQNGTVANGVPTGMDIGSLMGQLAGMGQGGANQLHQQQQGPPSFPSSPLAHQDPTATALQRLQQLQQLQHYQSQFIQQQVSPPLRPNRGGTPRGGAASMGTQSGATRTPSRLFCRRLTPLIHRGPTQN